MVFNAPLSIEPIVSRSTFEVFSTNYSRRPRPVQAPHLFIHMIDGSPNHGILPFPRHALFGFIYHPLMDNLKIKQL